MAKRLKVTIKPVGSNLHQRTTWPRDFEFQQPTTIEQYLRVCKHLLGAGFALHPELYGATVYEDRRNSVVDRITLDLARKKGALELLQAMLPSARVFPYDPNWRRRKDHRRGKKCGHTRKQIILVVTVHRIAHVHPNNGQ